jgi:DNA repair exonuclease SbcCD ATPase subunit
MDIRNLCKVLFAVLLVVGYAYEANAQGAPIGRDSNGQAYRTDASGFRIVDHVAELEVTVDDLRRQVRVLEDELDAKQGALTNQAPQPMLPGLKLKESDLITARNTASDRFDVGSNADSKSAEASNLRNKIKELESQLVLQEQLKQKNDDLQSELASLRQHLVQNNSQTEKIESKESQLRDKQDKLVSQLSALRQERERLANEASQKTKLSQRLAEMQARLAQKEQELNSALNQKDSKIKQVATKNELISEENKELMRKMQEAEARLAKAQAELESKQARQEKLAADLAAKAEETSKLQTQLAVVSETAAAYQAQALNRGRLSTGKASSKNVAEKSTSVGAPELLAGKKQINAGLQRIQQLISKRKNLADKLRQSQTGVSVSLSPLRTPNGTSLDRLRTSMKSMNSSRDIQEITTGVAQALISKQRKTEPWAPFFLQTIVSNRVES